MSSPTRSSARLSRTTTVGWRGRPQRGGARGLLCAHTIYYTIIDDDEDEDDDDGEEGEYS